MKTPGKIDQLRQKIDSLDDRILKLLNERAQTAKAIGTLKAKDGQAVLVTDREREILNRLLQQNQGPLNEDSVEDIFRCIFVASRFLQKKTAVAFFGPEGTFTHQVALKHFGRSVDLLPVPSISDVFSEVESRRADFGVVPIENSTEGIVNHTLDMFIDSDLQIIAEREEPISQNLFSLSGEIKKIKSVYSHPQALAQCRKWLDIHLPGVAIHEAASTSDAAVQATLEGSCAAISSSLAGQLYHLKPVALDIEDSPDNATRFLVIGRAAPAPTGKDKTSILFSIKDKVGALYEMLQSFREEGINLTKIESRPTKKKAWEYIFFVDFIGHQSDKKVQQALAVLEKQCTYLKILGSYPYGG